MVPSTIIQTILFCATVYGELSIRLLSCQNAISYATFGLCLCDCGISSRCSAAPWQSGHANSKMSTTCSSRLPGPSWQQQVVTQLGQCSRAVLWPIQSAEATEASFQKMKLVLAFSLILYFLPLPMNNFLLIHCGSRHRYRFHTWSLNWDWGRQCITWLNTVLWLGCSIQCDGTAVELIQKTRPCGSGLARETSLAYGGTVVHTYLLPTPVRVGSHCGMVWIDRQMATFRFFSLLVIYSVMPSCTWAFYKWLWWLSCLQLSSYNQLEHRCMCWLLLYMQNNNIVVWVVPIFQSKLKISVTYRLWMCPGSMLLCTI